MASPRAGAAGRHDQSNNPPDTSATSYPPGTTAENVALADDQVLRILRRAALHPGMAQTLGVVSLDTGNQVAELRLKHGPGGRLLIHPDDVSTPLAAALGAALKRLGCVHKLGVAPKAFPCAPVVPVPGRRP